MIRHKSKSKLYWLINAHKKFKAEFFMSQREMRVYWDEPRGELYGPLCTASRWSHWHRSRKGGAMSAWFKRRNRRIK